MFGKIRKEVEKTLDGNRNRWVKWIHVNKGFKHCPICIGLDGCCFVENKAPPVGEKNHSFCHYYYENIISIVVAAVCSPQKFTNYLFNPTKNNGKQNLFFVWGYTIDDSAWLQQEYMRQAKEKYEKGDYALSHLDKFGQRINICIELNDRLTGKIVVLESGWMVEPDGTIRLIAPMGRNKERL